MSGIFKNIFLNTPNANANANGNSTNYASNSSNNNPYCISGNNNNNNDTPTTPNKRLSFGAFCTSPGTLQDVTMENSYGCGYRSPCVSLQQQQHQHHQHQQQPLYQGPSPTSATGRSVREFEEQMAALRKENFNLKLRLYFMEESVPEFQHAINSENPQDVLMRQVIDLKVSNEAMRKDLEEKADLLKQASAALDHVEKIQQESEARNREVINELNQRLQYLETERNMDSSRNGEVLNELMGHANLSEGINSQQKIRELEGCIKQHEEQMFAFQKELEDSQEAQRKQMDAIREYEEKLKELAFTNAELLEQLEAKELEIAKAEALISSLRLMLEDLAEQKQMLSRKLQNSDENYCREQQLMKTYEAKLREQQDVLAAMHTTLSERDDQRNVLINRLRDYHQMLCKFMDDDDGTKCRNKFFRHIINKLQDTDIGATKRCGFARRSCAHTHSAESSPTNSNSNPGSTSSATNARSQDKSEPLSRQEIESFRRELQWRCNNLKRGEDSQQGESRDRRPETKHIKCDDNDVYYYDDTEWASARSNKAKDNNNANTDRDEITYCCTCRRPHGLYDCMASCGNINGRYNLNGGSRSPGPLSMASSESPMSMQTNLSESSMDSPTETAAFMSSCQHLREELIDRSAELAEKACLMQDMKEIGEHRAREQQMASLTIQKLMQRTKTQKDEIKRLREQLNLKPDSSDDGKSRETLSDLEQTSESHTDRLAVIVEQQEVETEKLKAECQRLREELTERKAEMADKACMLQDAEEKCEQQAQDYRQACLTIQKLMQCTKAQRDEIKRLKEQLNLKPDSSDDGKSRETLSDFEHTSASHNDRLAAIVEQQEARIEKLKAEVKKMADIQNSINHELKDKNREVERLTKLVSKKTPTPPVSPPQGSDASATELQRSFSDVDYIKALERNKLLQSKIDVLVQRLNCERNNESLISQLRVELSEAKADADNAEKWRRECADVCTVLSNRLEELAGFLNSLLKHKDVLGLVAADRRRAIRKAVDRSLDLSKSLNMSLSVSGLSFADNSLAQLNNLSHILGELEDNVCGGNGTFNVHSDLQANDVSVEALRAENKALKRELDKRRSTESKKDRRSLPLAAKENNSESEAWSEPDRKVSMARMGLEDQSISLTKEVAPTRGSAGAEPDSDSESEDLNHSRSAASKARTQERISQLEQMIAQRDERILQVQCQLVDADNRLKKENLRILEITAELQKQRDRNDELHNDLLMLGSDSMAFGATSSTNETLLRQIDEKTQSLNKIQEERNRLAVEAEVAKLQLETMKDAMREQKKRHEEDLRSAAESEKRHLKRLQTEMEAVMQSRLQEQERQHNDALARDWIARDLYEQTEQRLMELQRQYVEAEHSIDRLNEREQELKQALLDKEMSTRILQQQLDESTLQASKAVMGRTKALNDKLQVEQRLQELSQQLNALETERNTLQTNVIQLEKQITKMSRLSSDAGSGGANSGYTSEELMRGGAGAAAAAGDADTSDGVNNQRINHVGGHRQNNSSPDLGIESDAGRVSSVELSNAQRGQLKTVEIANQRVKTDDIKEELSDGGVENVEPIVSTTVQRSSTTGPIVHDCAKVEQENADLRRKLIRTKRAFEDTYEKLRIANQRKAQIEKDIKNQILKTHNVLKSVRHNMDSEK